MKKIIALVVSVTIATLTILFAVINKISTELTGLLLAFSIVSGIAIALHDNIKEISTNWFGLKTFDKKVQIIKDRAIEEIETELQNQKTEIREQKYDLSELGKALLKSIYLIVVTKNEIGGSRDQQARAIMEKDINNLIPKVLPDEQKRQKWVEELKKTLP